MNRILSVMLRTTDKILFILDQHCGPEPFRNTMARSQAGASDGLLEAASGSGRAYSCPTTVLLSETPIAPLALVAAAVGLGG